MKHMLWKSSIVALALTVGMSSSVFASNEDYEKDESVYVVLNSDGSVDNTTVTEWLHSDNELSHVVDKSNLTNIKNISSDETPTIDGDNLIWESTANDIYYQGNSDKPLPFSMDVTYMLDGVAINANDLAGKSGELQIHIKLKNDSVTTQTVDGKTINVSPLFPIVMIVNMPLEQFSNVNVDHGAIVSEGKNQIITMTTILGLDNAIDGMDVSQLDEIKDKLVTEFTITATVDTMDVPSIMLASATSNSSTSVDNVDMSELTNGINDLKDATAQILDGTVQLKDANIELNDKMGEFQGKVGEFKDGVNQVESGSKKLSEGSKALSEGIVSLQTQMNTLVTQLSGMNLSQMGDLLTLVGGTMESLKDVPDQLAAMQSQLNTAAGELAKVEESINQQMTFDVIKAQVNAPQESLGGVSAPKALIEGVKQPIINAIDAVTAPEINAPTVDLTNLLSKTVSSSAAINEEAIKQALLENGISEDKIDGVMNTIKNNVSSTPSYDVTTINQAVSQGIASQMPNVAELVSNLKAQLTNGISTSLDGNVDTVANAMTNVGLSVAKTEAHLVQESLNTKMGEMNGMITQANALLTKMTTTVNGILEKTKDIDFAKIGELGNKLPAASAGIQQLVDGGKQLYTGANDLHDGIVKLQDATNKIVDATNQFKDATQKLAESTGELNDGVTRFSQEGIDELDSKVNDAIGELDNAMDIVNTYLDESNIYTGYGDSVDGIQPSFKVIMKTKEVTYEPQEATVSETSVESTSFWQRVVDLFK